MGKIRVKTLGDEQTEKEQQKDALRKAQGKRERKEAEKGAKQEVPQVSEVSQVPQEKEAAKKSPRDTRGTHGTRATRKKRVRSKKYKAVSSLVEKNKIYSLADALVLLPKLKIAKFDETIELHINTVEPGLAGELMLPHGTGKKVRVAIADDKILADVERGKIEFDVLLAIPQMMPKLARVAKVLGPRGLMPNPKNGTITTNPEETAKKYAGGKLSFKSEGKLPLVNLVVGKMSFGEKKLSENITSALKTIKPENIKKVTLKSTMSPGLRIAVEQKS